MAGQRHRRLVRTSKTGLPVGSELLHDPRLNKGTAFTERERDALALRGLLPPHVHTQDEQVARVMENFNRKDTPLGKYIHMIALQDRNETLFYRVILEHLEEMVPIVYTPTVGKACQEYGHIFRRARGLFVSTKHRGRIADTLRNWPYVDIRIVVVTDGERILGLGDQGANGMGIPIGKLSLYTACAGVHPADCLPIMLDVGTDRQELLDDPLYIGVRHKRLRGDEYDEFVAEFIDATNEVFPRALVQFEDFANANAFRLLERYRDDICTFNDDIQGTGSMALSGLISAMRITGGKLKEQRLLFVGAGEAGIGIGNQVVSAMVDEGLTPEQAYGQCWFMDVHGLIVKGRDHLGDEHLPYAHEHEHLTGVAEAIESIKPNILFGASAQPKLFSQNVLEAMARLNERPVIFALSNPTSKAECTPEEAYRWTEGRAVYASGSPFPPVEYGGRTYVPGQANNAYIFPGVGLGAIACESTRVTDEMFIAAAKALSAEVSEDDLKLGRIYPSLKRIREVSARIAVAVAEVAYARGYARKPRPNDLLEYIGTQMYDPEYEEYV